MTEYEPKVGDRVRVTKEGVVDSVRPYEDGHTVSVDGLHYTTGPRYGHTITKLADPEPEWVNGDVILTDSVNPPLYYRGGGWYWCNADGLSLVVTAPHVSEEWRKGLIKVLHKVDASKVEVSW